MNVIGKSMYYMSFFIFAVLMVVLHPTVSWGQKQELPADLSATDQNYRKYSKGLELHLELKFDSAIAYYKQYRKGLNPGRDGNKIKEVEKRILECESGRILIREPRKFSIVNLGKEINSPFEDYAPVLTEDESLLVFTSRRPTGNLSDQKDNNGKYFEDIFFSKRVNDKWSSAQNMGPPVNTPFHDSDIALSADGRQLFLYTDNNEGDILLSEFANKKWNKPHDPQAPLNTSYHESSMSMSSDGARIFIASERPGGFGGSDIWVVEKNATGQWKDATNLGPSVNTAWDEESPFIDYDGETLFFSSTGHNSMGGYDIFRSQWRSNQWTKAENLGYPINTPGHDSYFVSTKDGKRAYYSSIREGGFGEEDIYLITLPEEFARGKDINPVVDSLKKASNAIGAGREQFSLLVYFPFGSSKILDTDHLRLDSFAIEISKIKNGIIQIDGHTDNIGPEKFNQALSLSRAKSVKSYLESKGVGSNRMIVKGWGTLRPVVSDVDRIKDRELNRRAELRVIYN